jgi:hypothetical protein
LDEDRVAATSLSTSGDITREVVMVVWKRDAVFRWDSALVEIARPCFLQGDVSGSDTTFAVVCTEDSRPENNRSRNRPKKSRLLIDLTLEPSNSFFNFHFLA